jgi:hypothetical protein
VDQRLCEETLIRKADISVIAFMELQNSFLRLHLPAILPSYSAEPDPLRGTVLFKLSVEVLHEISSNILYW